MMMKKPQGIFERSVQDFNQLPSPPARLHSLLVLLVHLLPVATRKRCGGSVSCCFSPEDYVAPALDATVLIYADKSANLDEVEMVYPSRRNSLVVGLSMALGGRTRGPSRKNLTYSMTQLDTTPVASPRSPKLHSLRSSLNFCLYVDVVQQQDDRPQFKTLYSQGYIPKSPQGPVPNRVWIERNPQLKFVILPDLLEGEGEEEDMVASTISDCLRKSTTELSLAEH